MAPRPSPRVVFFDIGGTLLNFSIEPSALFASIMAEHGVRVEPTELYRAMRTVEVGFPVPAAVSASSEAAYWRAYDGRILEHLGVRSSPELLDEIHRRFQSECTLTCFPESVEVLRALRASGTPLGVISNASHGILGDLERNGIAAFFDHVIYSQAIGAAKPDPRIFQEALRRFGVAPAASWHIGDNVDADIGGAKAVGIHPVLVDRAGRHPGIDAMVVPDLHGVVRLLREAA